MNNRLERWAWVILLSSFFLCVAVAVMTPLSVRWYLRNARTNQDVVLQVQRAPLSVIYGGHGRPRSVSEDTSDIPPGSRIVAPNATSGRLLVQAPQAESTTPIATVQLYDQADLLLASARSPRFSRSSLPHHIVLEMKAGRVRVNVYGESERPTVIEVRTAQGTITLREGSYEVKLNAATEVSVRYGEAHVVCAGRQSLVLGPRERALLGAEEIDGPLPTARNLVANGDFQKPLENEWEFYARQTDPQQPPGNIELVTTSLGTEERSAVSFSRVAANHAELGITQEINYDVRDFSAVELQMTINIVDQDILGFGGCGYLGSECPIIVRINYRDVYGADRDWLRGFYVGEPAEDWFLNWWSEKLERQTWQAYSSGNLMEELAATPPALIQSLTIHASGHSFDAMVTEVELLAQE